MTANLFCSFSAYSLTYTQNRSEELLMCMVTKDILDEADNGVIAAPQLMVNQAYQVTISRSDGVVYPQKHIEYTHKGVSS